MIHPSKWLSGILTYSAGIALLCFGISGLFAAFGHCLEDLPQLLNGWEVCTQNVSDAWQSVISALTGLGFIGVRRAISNSRD